MGTENESNPKKLTIADPVGKDVLDKLEELEMSRANVGMNLLDLKQEEVKLLAAARRIDEERHRVFERVLMERGLAPNMISEIDIATGLLKVAAPPAAQPVQSAPAPAAAAS